MGTAEGSHPPDVSEGVERNVIARGVTVVRCCGLHFTTVFVVASATTFSRYEGSDEERST